MTLAAIGAAAGSQVAQWALQQVENALTEGRSCVLEVDNSTGQTLKLSDTNHDHGGFAVPPKDIPPTSALVFGSQSTGFLTGTEGSATFSGTDIVLSVSWDNPWAGSNSCDANLSGNGAANYRLTHICGSGDTNAHMIYGLSVAGQQGWRWCRKCQGLVFSEHGGGVCPAGHEHDAQGSANYALLENNSAPSGQGHWLWCHKCEGIFFGGHSAGRCPAGGGHNSAGSSQYAITNNAPALFGQDNWRYCHKCEGLYFAGHGSGRCPAGTGHDASNSGDYSLVYM